MSAKTKNRKGRKILKPLLLVLGGVMGGYLYGASSEPNIHGHIMFHSDFEGNPHYEVMLFEEGKFPKVPYLRGRRLIDKDDTDFEDFYPIRNIVELKEDPSWPKELEKEELTIDERVGMYESKLSKEDLRQKRGERVEELLEDYKTLIERIEESLYSDTITDEDRMFLNYQIPKDKSLTNYLEMFLGIFKYEMALEDRIKKRIYFKGIVDGENVELNAINIFPEHETTELRIYNKKGVLIFRAVDKDNNKRLNPGDNPRDSYDDDFIQLRYGNENNWRIGWLYSNGYFDITENDKNGWGSANYDPTDETFLTQGKFKKSDLKRLQAEAGRKFKEADEKYRKIRNKIE